RCRTRTCRLAPACNRLRSWLTRSFLIGGLGPGLGRGHSREPAVPAGGGVAERGEAFPDAGLGGALVALGGPAWPGGRGPGGRPPPGRPGGRRGAPRPRPVPARPRAPRRCRGPPRGPPRTGRRRR